MRHNLGEQLAWLGSCQSWGDAFGTRLDADVLQQKVPLADPLPLLSMDTHWESLWRRAHEGKLHGGDVVEKKRSQRAGTVAAGSRPQQAPPKPTRQVEIEDMASGGSRGSRAAAPRTAAPQQQVPPQQTRQVGIEDLASGGSQGGYHAAVPRAASAPGPPGNVSPRPHLPMQQPAPWVPSNPQQPSNPHGTAPSYTAAAGFASGSPHGIAPGGHATAAGNPTWAASYSSAPQNRVLQPTPASSASSADAMQVLDQFAFSAGSAGADELSKALRAWRKGFAETAGKKAFNVLTNKALDDVVRSRPSTKDQLVAINGIGQKKVEEFGDAILGICQRFAGLAAQMQVTPQQAQTSVPQWPQQSTQYMAASASSSYHAPLASPRPPATPQMASAYPRTAAQSSSAESGVWLEPPSKRLRRNIATSSAGLEATSGPATLAAIEPGMLTDEQRAAAERALQGKNMFITGAAGTGKSFLLRFIIQELEKRHPGEAAITAPTGIAAVNVGGQTVHSFAGIGLWSGNSEWGMAGRIRKSPAASARWRRTRVLVIDEVSMLDPALFEQLECVARKIRESSKCFGGMQVVLCGDFLQLPPIEDKDAQGKQWSFCFQTPAWGRCGLKDGTVILQQSVRQAGDVQFVRLLNEVRIGSFSREVEEMCGRCHVRVKPFAQDGIVPTKLYCTNRDVERENDDRLAKLAGEEHSFAGADSFYARISGSGVPSEEKKKLTENLDKKVPRALRLKLNAQVILLKKLPGPGLVNGSRGVVVDFHGSSVVSVRFDTGQVVKVERDTFQQNGSIGTAYRKQLPLRLGWALTVHKSQGMTLSRAEVQVDYAFSCGQAYVALSRLTSFAGLWIGGRGISQSSIKAHPSALEFYGVPSSRSAPVDGPPTRNSIQSNWGRFIE